jgi:hypothetical protein
MRKRALTLRAFFIASALVLAAAGLTVLWRGAPFLPTLIALLAVYATLLATAHAL